jgi:hypothetical protein
LYFRPNEVYFFELSIKFLIDGYVTRFIKISRLTNSVFGLSGFDCRWSLFFSLAKHKILHQIKPKNIKIGQYFMWNWKKKHKFVWLPDRICFPVQKWKLTVIQKEKSVPRKDLSKSWRTKSFIWTAIKTRLSSSFL